VVLEKKFMNRQPAHASVLVPIVLREQPMVLLTRAHGAPVHPFGPGGFSRWTGGPEDVSTADTALREAEEEVGLERRFVEVLGVLPTYVTGSSFIITPVVALVQPDCVLHPNPYEVADVFEVPLAFLLNPAHHQRHMLSGRACAASGSPCPTRMAKRIVSSGVPRPACCAIFIDSCWRDGGASARAAQMPLRQYHCPP
jgi:8-oxo-dGTP pyrophosphatase MutT (NUDIX family)